MRERPLDIERLMQTLILRNSAPASHGSLRLAMAFEIHEAVPDSKLFIGLSLGRAEHNMKVDILGLVGPHRLAVNVGLGGLEADAWQGNLEQLERLCSAAPDLVGLALVVSKPLNGRDRDQRLVWRECASLASSPWAGLEYGFTWIDHASDQWLPTATRATRSADRPGR
jgi:hypothetical protein